MSTRKMQDGPVTDKSQYLPLFLEEADEVLALLGKGERQLMDGRGGGNDIRPVLQGLHRAAHTLKGSALMLGFEVLGDLASALERVFARVRDGQVPITEQLGAQIRAAVEALSTLKRDIAAGGAGDADTTRAMDGLAPYLAASSPAARRGGPRRAAA